MERVWQWAWERHGARYSWMVAIGACAVVLPIFTACALILVTYEDSDRYLVSLAVAEAIALLALYVTALPGTAQWRPVERWAAGGPVDPFEALESTYRLARRTILRGTVAFAVGGASTGAAVATLADADAGAIVQWAIVGTGVLVASQGIAIHAFVEGFMRPVRSTFAGTSTIGDALPRSRPRFVTWVNLAIVSCVWVFALAGTLVGGIIDRAGKDPLIAVGVATGFVALFGLPTTVGAAFAPLLRPIRDLAEGTARVAAGDYTQRLPVVQDDDLGVLVASFNRMQAGLAERERLHAAFGSYVDPALASRLLDQGDEVFTGERRDVTVMFVDIRDFTPFAESHTAEETVAHLNALFEIVVPSVVDAGGHVNKYLGDGALAVFGAPNELAAHADAAVAVAVEIAQRVEEHFQGELRVGMGINTGQVIVGTIGGGGKLEFTLIGDTVNVAARIEQLTKVTGDGILLTEQTVAALAAPPGGLVDRGAHELKGKAAALRVFALS